MKKGIIFVGCILLNSCALPKAIQSPYITVYASDRVGNIPSSYIILRKQPQVFELHFKGWLHNDYNDAIVTRTNRFLLAGDNRMPIILDYAFLFRARPTDYNTINMQIGNDANEPSLVLECL